MWENFNSNNDNSSELKSIVIDFNVIMCVSSKTSYPKILLPPFVVEW